MKAVTTTGTSSAQLSLYPLDKQYASVRSHTNFGVLLVVLVPLGVGGWAFLTVIAGAVVAPGRVVVESFPKKVQHQSGGTLGALLVHDGSRVNEGDLLARLDPTQVQANLSMLTTQLGELAVRRARLEAEREGASTITFPPDVLALRSDPNIAALIASETRLFELRVQAREGQKAQLREEVAQLENVIAGSQSELVANSRQLSLANQELEGIAELWRKKLVPLPRLTQLQREVARTEGENGKLMSDIAQNRGRIAEMRLRILQIDQDARSEVSKELSEDRRKMTELQERQLISGDMLAHIDIRAPQSGVVHQLTVHGAGGVISPAETFMVIVPDADQLLVECRIPPNDRDHLHIGQKAILQFNAFNRRTTPELNGEVSFVGADAETDAKSGMAYYTLRIMIPPAEMERLAGLKLVPGMPVEAFIQTGERSVISYLMKPLRDQFMRAFREP